MAAKWVLSILSAVAMTLGVTPLHAGEKALTLLNVSYDPTREPY
jgi:ABC-type sulfate transport system substrate-binding protein